MNEMVSDDVLRDQRNLCNKDGGGWKRSALNAAATMLSTSSMLMSHQIMSRTVSNYGDCGMVL